MTVRLRPHHLLCMTTYAGKGYSETFIANYDKVALRLAGGEDIVVVDGPDDICAPLLGEPDPHCRWPSALERDRQAAQDVGVLLGKKIVSGVILQLKAADLDAMRAAFAAGHIRAACAGCEWSALCDRIAADAFRGTALAGG